MIATPAIMRVGSGGWPGAPEYASPQRASMKRQYKLMFKVDHLIETGTKHVRLPGLHLLARPHDRPPSMHADMHAERESCFGRSREDAEAVLQAFRERT